MLKLSHHKHSFKPLPHHHTSFRGIFLLLLIVGVVLVSMHRVVHADFLDLNAKISAPLPTIAAEITAPVNGGIFTEPELTVRGTCEELDPAAIVVIYIDDDIGGSGPCQPGGSFEVPITLPLGTHMLVAKTSNTTEDFGPDSDPIQVTYKPKSTAPEGGTTTGGTAKPGTRHGSSKSDSGSTGSACTSAGPLRVVNTASYLNYGQYAAATWEFGLAGGCPPYRTTISWGDGTSDTITIEDNDIYEARHGYAELKPFYIVKMTVSSADKQRTSFWTVATTSYIPKLYQGGILKAVDEPLILSFEGTILRAYLAYLILLLIVALAWYDKHIRRVRIAGIHIFPRHPQQ